MRRLLTSRLYHYGPTPKLNHHELMRTSEVRKAIRKHLRQKPVSHFGEIAYESTRPEFEI